VNLVMAEVTETNLAHITPNAHDTTHNGGYDGVVARLAADGQAVDWATYFGGSGNDVYAPSIRLDAQGNAVIAGSTESANLPTTPGAFQASRQGPSDIHVAKFSADGQTLMLSTYLGGGADDGTETHNLALDADGNIVIGAGTMSNNFPGTAGSAQAAYGGSGGSSTGANTNYAGDGVVAVLAADGKTLVRATYVGGSAGDAVEGVDVGPDGRIYVTGATYSTNLPGRVADEADQFALGGKADFFLSVLSPDLSKFEYATYFGGNQIDYGRSIDMGPAGRLAIGGMVSSTNWKNLAGGTYPLHGGYDGGVVVFRILALGDWDLSGTTTNADIQAMLDALVDLDAYRATHGLTEPQLLRLGDIDRNGAVNNADIQAMLDLLTSQSGQSAAEISLEVFGDAQYLDRYATSVPEPASAAAVSLIGVLALRHRARIA
jgi:hypothetical protein